MKRYALVRNARSRSEAEAYLPENYRIIAERHDDEPGRSALIVYVIEGEDRLGWSLDLYVIPRLASGLLMCEEIDLSHPMMKNVPIS